MSMHDSWSLKNNRQLAQTLVPAVVCLENRVALTAFANPLQISSVNGLLDITMEAHRSSQVIEVADPLNPLSAGVPTLVDGFMTYKWTILNGESSTGATTGDGPSGPTLHINPGDTFRVHLVNSLGDQPTNFHTHGLVISPAGESDNVIISLPPGETNVYEYQIPADEEPGVAWYHPHRHEFTADQVYRGLAGFLVVGSASNNIDQVQDLPTRMMMIRSESIATDATTNRPTLIPMTSVNSGQFQVTINNMYMPDLQMQNTTELWVGLQLDVRDLVRTFQPVSNDPTTWNWDQSAQFEPYSTTPEGKNIVAFYVAQDGAAFPETVGKARVALAPGKRVSEVISAPPEGQTKYFVATVIQPTALTTEYTQAIMQIHGIGAGGLPAEWVDRPLTSSTMQYEDLSKEQVDVYRTVVFQTVVVDGVTQFQINGKTFPNTPVFQPRAGQVEEWHVINLDKVPHPIHLHMQHFQSQTGYDWALPPHNFDQDVWYTEPQATSVFRIKFKPTLGESVFHCHNLFHEDGGMMASLNVIPAQPLLVTAESSRGGTARFYPLGSGASEKISGTPVATVQPFGPTYKGGMTSAMGDVNDDGVPDAVFGSVRGGRVVVLDGASNFQTVLYDFKPFGSRFRSRVEVAVGDVNGDNRSDIIVAGGLGSKPIVRAFSGASGKLLTEFEAYESNFRGGLKLATGDVDGSGRIRIVTTPANAHRPEVKVWGWSLFTPNHAPTASKTQLGQPELIANYLAGDRNDRRGLTLTTTYYAANTGGFARIVTAPARGSQEATVWQLSDMSGHMMNMGDMASHMSATKLTTIRAFPGRSFRSGLSLGSVSTPTGSLLAITARGCKAGLVRFFNAPKGVEPVASGEIHARLKGSVGLSGS